MAKIISPKVISVGDLVIIDDFVFVMGGIRIVIASFVHIASFTSITGGSELIMEDFTGLASGIRVLTGTDDSSGGSLKNPTAPYPYRLPIRSFVRIKKHGIVGVETVIVIRIGLTEKSIYTVRFGIISKETKNGS